MALPRQVVRLNRQVAELETKVRETQQAETPPAETPPAETPPAPTPPEPTPPVESPPPLAAVAPPAAPVEDEAAYRQRYESLRGMYNTQVPAMQQRIRELEARGLATAPVVPTPPVVPEALPEVTADERKEWGDDFFKVVETQAKRATREQMDGFSKRLAELQASVENVSGSQARTTAVVFQNTLGSVIPGWEEQDRDPGFLAWLAETDPYSGTTRQDLLRSAVQSRDVGRTARFFVDYRAQQAPVAPPAPPRRTMADIVTPASSGRQTGADQAAASGGRVYTQKEIGQFYSDMARGKFRKNEAEARKIESDILLAISEGRAR